MVMELKEIYKHYCESSGICTDSRNLLEGGIFCALKGETFDGNDYAEEALKICKFAIVDRKELEYNKRCIVVEDSLKTLQGLANFHRKVVNPKVLAITGTNGKTTTKELVASVLGTKYKVHATVGNFNNHIGVPLTLLSMPKDVEMAVIEMGANKIGDIEELCNIAAPDFGIITNVGRAHLEGFGSFDGVKLTKGELYKYLYKNKGVAFVNADNSHLEEMDPPNDSVYYGTKGFSHCEGRLMDNYSFLKFAYISSHDIAADDDELDWDAEDRIITTNLFGEYNLENALAAVCVGIEFGVPEEKIKSSIEAYMPTNNRSQLIRTGRNIVLLDAYNANPTSMNTALEVFDKFDHEEKIVVLGDMLELGNASYREHHLIIAKLEGLNFEKVYLVGKEFMNFNENENFEFYSSIEVLVQKMASENIENKAILLKGSRGVTVEKLLKVL
jgi:UDP-N-acetylmuramoyl-tripeptide--D-alanyl-D-alanine ligase